MPIYSSARNLNTETYFFEANYIRSRIH